VPHILAINKIDLVKPEEILSVTATFSELGFEEIIPVSAASGSGLQELSKCLVSHLPEGPQYFPEDMMTDQPERLLCAEIIREKTLRHLRDEIPHGIGVEMMRMETVRDDLTEIHATLYCERESHKRIIIGKQGSMLKAIGSEARIDIEKLLGTRINLQLWVKVRPDWRNNVSDLKALGYES
jgi:GTP-binding protein Era